MAVDFSNVPKLLNIETIEKWVNDRQHRYSVIPKYHQHKTQLFPMTKPNGELHSGVTAYPISLYLQKRPSPAALPETSIAFDGWALAEDVPSVSLKKGDVLQFRLAGMQKQKTYIRDGTSVQKSNILPLEMDLRNPYDYYSPMYDWRLVDSINAQDVMRNIEHMSLLLFEGIGIINRNNFYDTYFYNILFENLKERPFFINFFLKKEGKVWSSKKDSFATLPALIYNQKDGERLSIEYEPPVEELNK